MVELKVGKVRCGAGRAEEGHLERGLDPGAGSPEPESRRGFSKGERKP